ncbi:uncharacterized protein LOC119276102 [Triticum dicoccoides]|uniref:uncharacterized protein LOC119276102 n=1 Tax=Triticum dicoccoides TaxID=85692 RepID=UPI000E7BEE74|nr:uncharacterized protein LOC119276102 [Triticum dicoccoides]
MTTRRWWKRRDGSDDADDLVPMDTQEQEELVRSLEQKQVHQSRRWRHVFAGFLLSYTVFLVYSSFHHAWSPWELRYHAYFMEDLPSPMVIVADWIAALACLFAVKGLLQASNSSKKWIWYSFYVGMAVAIFWTYYLLKLPMIRWDVVWLPLGPFDCFCIEPLCGPYANEVDARYQHLEGLHVQLQVPVMLSILLVWVLHLAALFTWDTPSFVSTCDLSFSISERQVKISILV